MTQALLPSWWDYLFILLLASQAWFICAHIEDMVSSDLQEDQDSEQQGQWTIEIQWKSFMASSKEKSCQKD